MAQVTFYRKRNDGFYDGHIVTQDGMMDMNASYRVVMGKTAPPTFPTNNPPGTADYDPTKPSFYFVPKQDVDNMSSKERANLAMKFYSYETTLSPPPVLKWCPPADPCMPVGMCCTRTPLGPGPITGIVIGILLFMWMGRRLAMKSSFWKPGRK